MAQDRPLGETGQLLDGANENKDNPSDGGPDGKRHLKEGSFRPAETGLGTAAKPDRQQKMQEKVLTGPRFGGTLADQLDRSWLTGTIWERSNENLDTRPSQRYTA